MLRPVKKARKAKKAKKAKPELNLSHLFTFFHDGLGGDAFADDERVRLLAGLVVLLPVVPLPEAKQYKFSTIYFLQMRKKYHHN